MAATTLKIPDRGTTSEPLVPGDSTRSEAPPMVVSATRAPGETTSARSFPLAPRSPPTRAFRVASVRYAVFVASALVSDAAIADDVEPKPMPGRRPLTAIPIDQTHPPTRRSTTAADAMLSRRSMCGLSPARYQRPRL